MTRWYRAYEGTASDPKLAEAALIAETSKCVVIACWHAILESCAGTNDHGRYETTARRIAATLGEKPSLIEAVFCALSEVGMIADGGVCAWSKRQFESDNSTERSRKHRTASRNVDATLQQQHATPPDTDTDTDTDKKDIRAVADATRPRADAFEAFWKAYPRRSGANPKAPAKAKFDAAVKSGLDPGHLIACASAYRTECEELRIAGSEKVAQALTWLSQKRWGDYEGRAETPEARADTERIMAAKGWEWSGEKWVNKLELSERGEAQWQNAN
jgi:hypothetical protein